MYYCNDCKHEFEDPKMECELHGELAGMGGEKYEYFSVCPICGSEDIEEEEVCDLCKNYRPKLIPIGGKWICKECDDWVWEKLRTVTDDTAKHFDISNSDAEKIVSEISEEL